jgi:hypothetical protein
VRGYVLVAQHNLPAALALDNGDAWMGDCECQGLCNTRRLTGAYNEVRCTRLVGVSGDRRGLSVHASAPLRNIVLTSKNIRCIIYNIEY